MSEDKQKFVDRMFANLRKDAGLTFEETHFPSIPPWVCIQLQMGVREISFTGTQSEYDALLRFLESQGYTIQQKEVDK